MPFADLAEFRVYYEEHGEGDHVLLINGLSADHTAWTPQIEGLNAHFHLVVLDNPGVGQTTGPRGPYTSELFADVAAELLAHLGVESAHIVGASMGGTIAQQIALRHPTLTRSLALHCTWGRCDRYLELLFRSWIALRPVAADPLDFRRLTWLFGYTPRWLEQPGALEELEQKFRENPYPQGPEGFIDQAEACISHDALDELAKITAPTLIAVGDTDLLTPSYHSYAIRERMPDARFHVWSNMGHVPFAELPDEFNELNRDFMSAH